MIKNKSDLKLLKLFITSLIFGFLFIIVYLLMYFQITNALDKSLNLLTLGIQTNFLISLFLIITELGSSIFVGIASVCFAIYLYIIKSFKELKIFLSAIVIDLGVVYILKHLIIRIRPINPLEALYSFPSGHATISVVFLGFIGWFFWNKKRVVSYILFLLILLVGFSRLILNLHWFTDVLAGYFLGISILTFCIFFFNNYLK